MSFSRLFSSKPPCNDVIGIDLGTTNSTVSVLGGKVISMPSVVAFCSNGDLLVGTPAKLQASTNPTGTLFGLKHLIGRRFHEGLTEMVPYKVVKASNDDAWIEIDCQPYSPSQICSHLVRELKKSAEAFLGRDVTKAVITAPAYFTDTQRRATMDAARIAGLDVLKIISEPCAAALSYGLNNTKDGHVAILHFGGATLIVSILEISNGAFEIKATSGCTFVGGDAFDDNLLDYLVSEFKKTESIDLSTDKPALQRLREAAEKAKVELSSATQTNIHLPYITSDASGAKHLNITLTRSELESVVGHLIEEINIRCRVCLNNAGLNVKDINEVLLVGGTTRLHKVNEVVTEFFGKSPSKGVSPDEAVALGAAIQGGILRKDLVDVDWRLRGAVTSVMRQGFVNTCWAIGVTAASESAIFIKNGKLNKLSSQQVVDCAVINGCAGAPQSLAYRYIITHGVCLEEQYPYTGVCQPCVDIKSPRFFIDSYGKVPAGNKHLIAAVNRQPLTAVLSRFFVKSPLYQSYRGGTYYGDNSDFPVSDTDLPHLVCIVGCGATEGQKHLIIKESMGVEWGDKGFLYLAMNREFILGLGDVNMAVYYPIINGNRAVCLTEEQISKLKEAFTLFGETKDLGAVMRHLGENLTEAELESMITEGGVDESITFPVFRNMVARKLEDSKIKVLKGLFRVTDKDQDGFVSAADMVQTMPLLGVESVIQLFQETDADGDGLLNCEEFLRMMLIG